MNQAQVTLVIPGRNCAGTIRPCLDAVAPLLASGQLAEIIFVNDGSTDETEQIVRRYPVRCLTGEGRGPGAARNVGWRAARTPLVWFLDSDCVAQPRALALLLEQLDDPQVGGAGGSYANMLPNQLLACLIHEEIAARHRNMPREVNYLATFNVLYRRAVLEELGGFDPTLRTSEDAEMAFRVRKAGHRLRFNAASRAGHYHPARLAGYLRTQARHGYYRMLMYRRHPTRMSGDSYSGPLDHIQPPLAMLLLGCLPFAFLPAGRWALATLAALLGLTTLPMTLRVAAQTRQARYLAFAPMSFARAFARGLGMTVGAPAGFRPTWKSPPPATPREQAEADESRARAA